MTNILFPPANETHECVKQSSKNSFILCLSIEFWIIQSGVHFKSRRISVEMPSSDKKLCSSEGQAKHSHNHFPFVCQRLFIRSHEKVWSCMPKYLTLSLQTFFHILGCVSLANAPPKAQILLSAPENGMISLKNSDQEPNNYNFIKSLYPVSDIWWLLIPC